MAPAKLAALLLVIAASAQLAAAQGAPKCGLYSVDMAFCGGQGLVTDRNSTTVILACDQPFSGLCSGNQDSCLRVSGPSGGQVTALRVPYGGANSLQADLSWESAYQGPVSVSLPCALSNAGGQSASVPDLQFSVEAALPVLSTAFQFV